MASPGSLAGSSGNESEGEEPEEPSSHFNDLPDANVALESLTLKDDEQNQETEDELALFRQQWQRELGGTPAPQQEPETPPEPEPQTDEDRAKQLFLRGVEMERGRKLYEAIHYYKHAMQIMPDVERRLYESSERADTPEEEPKSVEVEPRSAEAASEDEDAVEGEDLLARLQRIVAKKGVFCEPAHPTKGAHISWLPHEVMLVVLRWVVSAELDATSLERVAAVSRGLYVLARDPALWRALCLRTWGAECGGWGGAWRRMFLQRPRLLLHGCYISKASYLRPGELSFQDHCYRPWHLVDYYRYLRFFPDGLALMWTTAEEPAACVPQLKTRQPRAALGVLAGHYRLMADKVVIVLKKTNSEKKSGSATNTRFRSRRKESHEHHEQTFHLELQLRDARGRRNWQLSWRRYAACARRDQWTQFDLSPAKFPPFAFSRVRAYTAEAHAPLAAC